MLQRSGLYLRNHVATGCCNGGYEVGPEAAISMLAAFSCTVKPMQKKETGGAEYLGKYAARLLRDAPPIFAAKCQPLMWASATLANMSQQRCKSMVHSKPVPQRAVAMPMFHSACLISTGNFACYQPLLAIVYHINHWQLVLTT